MGIGTFAVFTFIIFVYFILFAIVLIKLLKPMIAQLRGERPGSLLDKAAKDSDSLLTSALHEPQRKS
jgi:hypothetical protein